MVKFGSSITKSFSDLTSGLKGLYKKGSLTDAASVTKKFDLVPATEVIRYMPSATRKDLGDGAVEGPFKGLTKSDAPALKSKKEELRNEKLDTPADVRSAGKKLLDNVGTGNVLVAAGLGSALLYFYIRKEVSEKTPRTITKVEMSGSDYKITYTPAINILTTDEITISGCSVVPDINGKRSVINASTDDVIVIRGAGNITTPCASTSCGTITVKSSVYGQMADAVDNMIPELLPDANVFLTYWWVFLIIALLICSSSAAAFIMSGK